MNEQVSEAFDKIAALALKTGVKDLRSLWLHKVDEKWTVAINGADEALRAEPEGMMGATIEPFNAAVWYNGWLAGSLSPLEGIFAAGSGANEDSFIEALDRAIAA